jgi:NAD(P)-dependent dehydrogenase (short-subunit alcohol dehydrogenase family)
MTELSSLHPHQPPSPIVVFGGTGYYGRSVVQKLLAKGEAVRGVSRNRTKAVSILGDQVEITEGDVTNRDAVLMIMEEACSMPEMARKIAEITGRQVKHITIPLVVVGIVSFLVKPFLPYLRYLYMSLLMFNNFPKDLADQVPEDHRILRNLFSYNPVTLDMEIRKRLGMKK